MHLFRSRKSAVAPWPVPNMGSRPERDCQGVAKTLKRRLRGLKGPGARAEPFAYMGFIKSLYRKIYKIANLSYFI